MKPLILQPNFKSSLHDKQKKYKGESDADLIYDGSVAEEWKTGEAEIILTKKIDQSRSLFTYLILFIAEVARYAEKDALKKASKHLPTAEDLAINTKIAGNELFGKF